MADELDRSFLEDLDNEMLLKMGECDYKRSLYLLPTLNKFRREGESGFCDVILETEGRHFSVHRCVLAANSRFFYTMFNSGMRESTEKILKLPSVSCVAMENILDFFYTQEIRLTEDVIEDVLEASSFLLLESLKKICIDILTSRISVHNCFSTKRLALEYNAVELLDKVDDFIRDNFLLIVEKSEEFLRLSSDELCELLKCPDIRVKDETQVYFAVLEWLAAVAMDSHILAIGGSTDQVVGTTAVEQFDPGKNSWKFLPAMNTRRLLANVVFAHGLVYVLGGHDNAFDRISTCEVLDPSTYEWSKIAPLPDTLHTNQSVVTLNNEIIAITGFPDVACNAAWYNRDADVWEKIQNFGLQFNIAGYRLCCLQVKKFFLQELPKTTTDTAHCNINIFPKQENFEEESDALVADLGLSLSEEEDNYESDSDEIFF
ncbi:hypothetical protein QZH41_000751 [Actinostola sp. cb2023]|nr:hypothetical protein QZH41_000751 [Actinostola sp. cb2023]